MVPDAEPVKPSWAFFFITMLMIPDWPSASYFDEGLVITSMVSIALAGIDCKISVRLLPVNVDGLPLINTLTSLDPRKLKLPSTSTCTDGTLANRAVAEPPWLTKLCETSNDFLSMPNLI